MAPSLIHESEAIYPTQALKEGLEATVHLRLTIGVNGSPTDIEVITPAGHGFDEAAIGALTHSRFSPATKNGKAIAVRIDYAYHFVQDIEAAREPASDTPVLHTVQGVVRQKGTRTPLAGASLHIEELQMDAETNTRGRFSFKLPAGRYHLKVAAEGHETANTRLTVSPLYLTTVDFYLPSLLDQRYTTVVRERRDDRAEEPVIRLSQQELRRVPGTFGDPLRVIQTLPGVARPRSLEGDIVVRGSEPGNTPLYLGGFEVPFLYHFGILQSIVDPVFVDGIDFYPGAVPLRYGNAAQGIVDVRANESNATRASATASLGVSQAAGAATLPLLDDKLRFDLGGRYSYAAVSLPLIMAPMSFIASQGEAAVSIFPNYWDYNLQLSAGPKNMRSYAKLYGAHDGVTVNILLVRDLIRRLLGQRGQQEEELPSRLTLYDQTFHHLVAGTRMRLNHGLELSAAALLGTQTNLNILATSGFGDLAALMRQDTTLAALRLDLRLPVSRFLAWRSGLDLEWRDIAVGPTDEIKALGELLPSAREQTRRLGFYNALEGKPWPGGRFTIGVRLQADRQHNKDYVRVDPRVVVEQDAAFGLVAQVAYSRQSQIPDFLRTSEVLGAADLPMTVSDQAMGGLRWGLPFNMEAGVTTYVSRMSGLALQEPGWEVRVDEQSNEARIQPLIRYIPARGYAYGLELSLRRRPQGRFYGWLSYSISRSIRSTATTRSFVGDYDQPHHLIAVAAYKLGWGVEISARFRLASGNPYTPMIGAFDVDTRAYDQVRGPHNAARDPLYHQLDLRVDKTFTFDKFKVGLYLDVYNAYMAQNPLPFSQLHLYSYDTLQVRGIGSLPLIPFFGISAEL